MSDLLGTNFDGTASVDATFANMREAAVAKATSFASVAPVAPATPQTPAASPVVPAASQPGTPAVQPPPVNTPPVFGSPQQEPVAQAEPPAPTDTQLTQQEAADLNDATHYRIVTNGKPEVVLGSELKKRTMLHSDYTRKTQEHAERVKLFADAIGLDPRKLDANTLQQFRVAMQEHQQMSQILSDPSLYDRYGREVFKASQVAPPAPAPNPVAQPQTHDPNAIVSYGDVQGLVGTTVQQLEAKLTQLREESERIPKSVAEQVQVEIRKLEDHKESIRMRGQVEATITSVAKQHPILNAIPNLVELVKFETYKMNPQTEQELYRHTQSVLGGILERIGQTQAEQQRVDVAARARVLTQGIEPPTGTAPSLAPTKLDSKDPKFWDNLGAAARSYGAGR